MKKESSVYRNFYLRLPEEDRETFKQQSNFYATSQSSYAYILFYLGKNKLVKEEELRAFQNLLDNDDNTNYLLLSMSKPMINDIKGNPRYEFAITTYISYVIYREYVLDDYYPMKEKNELKSRLSELPITYADIIDNLKKDYRITFSTLINYGYVNNLHEMPDKKIMKISKEKKTKSMTVIPETLQKMEIKEEDRAKQIINIIDNFA